MPQPDLTARARSAETAEEECDVIDDALQVLWRGKLNEIHALYDLIDSVRIGRLPRAVLLGVVAALRPQARGFEMAGTYDDKRWFVEYCDKEVYAPTPPLALLIAILEAANG